MIRGDELVEILLVEDNPSDLQLTLHALERNKLANRIHVVRDGVEALDFLFSTGAYAERTPRNPRVVLLDLKLPRIDGLEVLRRMKEEPRTRTIPDARRLFFGSIIYLPVLWIMMIAGRA